MSSQPTSDHTPDVAPVPPPLPTSLPTPPAEQRATQPPALLRDTDEARRLREEMVAGLRASGAVISAEVERALLRVPRHLFLPGSSLAEAYKNVAIATRWDAGAPVSSVSQPEIVALMLEQLRVEPGMRALEIGAGSGYNAALLAELVGPQGRVISIEIDAELAAAAAERLALAGYPPERAMIIAGDGWRGWPPQAPYARVELTVGAMDISPAWFQQLGEGGLMVAPLWLGTTDVSVALRKRSGVLASESWAMCGFVRMRGEGAASATQTAPLADGMALVGPGAATVAPQVAALLRTRPRRVWWGGANRDFIHYLALATGRVYSLWQPNRRRNRRARGRFLLTLDGPEGPSLALFPNRAPALLVFGTPLAESVARERLEVYRRHGSPPMDHWSLFAYPPSWNEPPPEDALRLTTPHWVYDISLGSPPSADAPPAMPATTGGGQE